MRVLTDEHTAALQDLTVLDPVAHIFIQSQLDGYGTAEPAAASSGGALFLGYFDDDELLSACWVGSNVVPLTATEHQGQRFGEAIRRLDRHFSSVFGPSDAVRGIWEALRHGRQRAFSVRESQPLLATATPSSVAPAATLRRARPEEYDVVLPASAAMFEEELGYSALATGGDYYRRRVRSLIVRGHCLVDIEPAGGVKFKADLGTVTPAAAQIQGVWLAPELRGRGLSTSYMSAMLNYTLDAAPIASLYVNDYNDAALAAYRRVGFERVGEFATVLF
ncbi:GNAT family N-acetyltransferase [Zhihengliuella sp.]|uniref:GNAT family N-acetyltransferase n=1 Tax=Zhihengliuella sp. TaxID=1954483 RepID=UPI002810D878|nr:GNAT family N-acetyltransferase [Zhihengliuella sp.]